LSFVVRPSRAEDLGAIYEMAKLTGGGFTNLPPDREALLRKLVRSEASFAGQNADSGDDVFLLVLEDTRTGQVRGTAQVFSRVGSSAPFYSYRRGTLTQNSRELGRTFRAQMLTLSTDLEGSSEVGGLFLHPRERAGGLGLLLARSRYLFIRRHRERFGDRVIAELRGVIDEAGGSPFWDGLAGRFFGMSFQEADEFNAKHGNQFIADLMPKTPIYIAMLPESAQAVIGLPHLTGRAAMRMLEAEGFAHDCYLDIFDGGPTVTAATDAIRTVREARIDRLRAITDGAPEGAARGLVSAGTLDAFRVAYGHVGTDGDGAQIDASAATLIGVTTGGDLLHVSLAAS
jgi:arginine N-succinyltransferase